MNVFPWSAPFVLAALASCAEVPAPEVRVPEPMVDEGGTAPKPLFAYY